ncbi:acetate kinase [Mizugakiibacter sediminis]|uniref:Acetate kinase n=2 Tax=Mizugakiibacter sediminis TaxID=1475481 RepID=A0A0K8QPW4_9GAMM|nr:acetate/propionate family kinase [Mizugakiibacter sediminis]GAP66949.1 acetate kinase [Mizugakiibacter sediminis]
MGDTRSVLVFNAGSSSLKFAAYRGAADAPSLRGAIERIGAGARLVLHAPAAEALGDTADLPADGSLEHLARWLMVRLRRHLADAEPAAIGHRIVHGGATFAAPARLDEAALDALERLIPLAPQHQPYGLAVVRAAMACWPASPQIACFDTAFHRGQPRLAQLFALPRALTDAGIVRYGFHGLSYAYIAGRLSELLGARADGRVLVAHLGHGASLCAMRGRRSIATTMGFTVMDGLMMARRCGALDPGVLLYLMQERGMDPARLVELLNERSGLLGVSGLSDDVRELEASGDPHAEEALELFAYRAAGEIGAMVAALGGLDALVFTAGIGERSAAMRRRICARLRWLGVELDAQANARHAPRIGAPQTAVDVLVVPTDEEIVIARAARAAVA